MTVGGRPSFDQACVVALRCHYVRSACRTPCGVAWEESTRATGRLLPLLCGLEPEEPAGVPPPPLLWQASTVGGRRSNEHEPKQAAIEPSAIKSEGLYMSDYTIELSE